MLTVFPYKDNGICLIREPPKRLKKRHPRTGFALRKTRDAVTKSCFLGAEHQGIFPGSPAVKYRHYFFTGSTLPVKILHTSDWHLGRLLLGERRDTVFTQFLDWLLTTLNTEQCDALLIAGDIFDSTVPGTSAQKLYYSFLARVRQETACRTVVITGGNHDSPMLLNAPRDLLSAFDIHVVGRATADPANEVVVIRNPDGHPAAVVCAVPFLREGDLSTLSDEETHLDRRQRLIDATANHYRTAEKAAFLTKHAVNVEVEELTPEKVFELRLEAAKVDENDSERVPLINAYQELLFSLHDAEQD